MTTLTSKSYIVRTDDLAPSPLGWPSDFLLNIRQPSRRDTERYIYGIADNPLALAQYFIIALQQFLEREQLIAGINYYDKQHKTSENNVLLSLESTALPSNFDSPDQKHLGIYLASTSSALQPFEGESSKRLSQQTTLHCINDAAWHDRLRSDSHEQIHSEILQIVSQDQSCFTPILDVAANFAFYQHKQDNQQIQRTHEAQVTLPNDPGGLRIVFPQALTPTTVTSPNDPGKICITPSRYSINDSPFYTSPLREPNRVTIILGDERHHILADIEPIDREPKNIRGVPHLLGRC